MIVNRKSAPCRRKNYPVIDRVALNTISYIGFRHEIIYPDDDYAQERDLAINQSSKDGVKPMTKEEQEIERKASYSLVKKFTMNIFKMDFTCFSFPCIFSEPRSFLERTSDMFTFLANKYIERAQKETNPEDKLLQLAIGIIAGFHLYMKSKKPWNPVLGETYVCRWPNGTTFYGEQTSHHPPTSDFQIFGPNNSWTCTAHTNFTIDSGIFQVDVLQSGLFKLEFTDGNTY